MKYNTSVRTTKRVQTKCDGPSRVDKSFAKAADINNIVTKFHKTGLLPETGVQPVYGDVSSVPSLEDVHSVLKKAQDAFQALPSDVRKLMDNNALKMESWLLDPNNRELAEKHGLLKAKVETQVSTGGADQAIDDSITTINSTNSGDSGANTSN